MWYLNIYKMFRIFVNTFVDILIGKTVELYLSSDEFSNINLLRDWAIASMIGFE